MISKYTLFLSENKFKIKFKHTIFKVKEPIIKISLRRIFYRFNSCFLQTNQATSIFDSGFQGNEGLVG
ncbi:hypothetical protein HpHA217_03030 [Helicobacter pylori]